VVHRRASPELKSRPFELHPLFRSFIAAAVEQSRLVLDSPLASIDLGWALALPE
jgi:hypothetical protein